MIFCEVKSNVNCLPADAVTGIGILNLLVTLGATKIPIVIADVTEVACEIPIPTKLLSAHTNVYKLIVVKFAPNAKLYPVFVAVDTVPSAVIDQYPPPKFFVVISFICCCMFDVVFVK